MASFSNINLGWYSNESGSLRDDSPVIASYQRVIRLNCMLNCILGNKINSELYLNCNIILAEPSIRPIIIVGSLADLIADKLITEFPEFKRYTPEVKHCPQASMEKEVADGLYIDYRKKGPVYECVSVSGLKQACNEVNT